MKLISLLLFILTFSCIQQESAFNNSDPNTVGINGSGPEIAYNNEDGGNGGTGIDAFTRGFYLSIGQRALPRYMYHMDTSMSFRFYEIRIKLANNLDNNSFTGIQLNGSNVNATFSSEDNMNIFSYDSRGSIRLTSFNITTNTAIPAGSIESIEVMAGTNSADSLYYSATNLTSSRANFYNSTNIISFEIVPENCSGMTQTEYNGTCVQHFIYCSDYNHDQGDNMFCKIKRDDGQEVFCYPVESLQICKDHANNICGSMSTLVQYNNQMFWGEINSNVLQTIQCPLVR